MLARYDPDGDIIEFNINSNSFYAKYIDRYFSIYLEQETDKICGFVISFISYVLRSNNIKFLFGSSRMYLNDILLVRLASLQYDLKEEKLFYYKKAFGLCDGVEVILNELKGP